MDGASRFSSNRSIPASTLIPVLAYADAVSAAAWLARCFGFEERLRIGTHRVQLTMGDAAMVALTEPARVPASGAPSHAIMLRVADVDRHYAQAVGQGVAVAAPPETYPFGERQYSARDLGGHAWTFTQSVSDVDPAAWGGILLAGPAGARPPALAVSATLHSTTPVFLVADIAATRAWYRQHLQFDGTAYPDVPPHAFAVLMRDRVEIMLQQRADYVKPALYATRDGGVWDVYVRMTGVAALFDTVARSGAITIVEPLRTQWYGDTEFVVKDLNGYVLVFSEGPVA